MSVLTLLTPDYAGHAVCKAHRRLSTGAILSDGYPNVKWWRYGELPITGDFGEFAVSLDALEHASRFIALRGAIRPEVDINEKLVRRLHADGSVPATFYATENPWMMTDIDNWINTIGTPLTRDEMEAILLDMIERVLPPEFHGVACWYQWSNSMLIHTDWTLLKVHLWHLLDEPRDDATLTQFAENNGAIDESVYRAVQPHYIAKPLFVGMNDPLGDWRSGVLNAAGQPHVVFTYTPRPPEEWAVQKNAEIEDTQRAWKARGALFEYIASTASPPMRRIAEIGVGGRLHMPIVRSAASWIVHCGVSPNKGAWKQLVRERVDVSGHREAAHRGSDLYLDACWRSAQRKFVSAHPDAPGVPRELIKNPNQF